MTRQSWINFFLYTPRRNQVSKELITVVFVHLTPVPAWLCIKMYRPLA